MVNDVIARLEEGSIKSVALFADSMKVPAPPCVIVKPEAGVRSGTRSFRIIVRHAIGKFDALEAYALGELDRLLLGGFDGKSGRRYMMYRSGFGDVAPDPGGNCIYMERIFCAPMPGLAN